MNTADLAGLDDALLISKTRRIIRAIGLVKTMVLLEALGGTYVELPNGRMWRKAISHSPLIGVIGPESAAVFYSEFARGDRRMLLPKVDKILLQLRDQKIRADAGTITVRDQALQYRLTVRQIFNIRASAPPPPPPPTPQLGLFSGTSAELDAG